MRGIKRMKLYTQDGETLRLETIRKGAYFVIRPKDNDNTEPETEKEN